MKDIDYLLSDIITERPHEFKVGRKSFKLYPVTLGKIFILKILVEAMGVNKDILHAHPHLEALRLAREKREECCKVLAYHTAPNSYKELYNSRAITIRCNYFAENLSDEDIASLMIIALNYDQAEEIMEHLGINKERERLARVMEVKKKFGKNSLTFNGCTLFGSFIAPLKEMGYSDNEILFEKSYTFLRLMLADKVVDVYLTDEERENLPSSDGGSMLDANNPANTEKIMGELHKRGLNVRKPKRNG